MADFQIAVADPETGRSHRRDIEGQDANRFIGKSIGDEVDGGAVGLSGYTLEITGGSDETGRPMRPDVAGPNLKKILVAENGVGYKPDRDGERKRVTVRGREISDVTSQVNVAVAEAGSQSIEELFGADDDESDD